MKLEIAKIHYAKKLTKKEKALKFVLNFLSFFYLLGTGLKNLLYKIKILKPYNAGVFTISVGNLTTGGTGKTPITAEIAKYFINHGETVAILSRGYGGKLQNKEVNIIADGKTIFFNAEMSGDEPFWLAENIKGVIVLTCSSRIKSAKIAKEKFNASVLILDDGFQHRKLHRDLEILVIDSEKQFGNEFLLPAGPLREPLKEIQRANKIIISNKNSTDNFEIEKLKARLNFYDKKSIVCNMTAGEITEINTGEELNIPQPVIAFSAIGQPQQFYNIIPKAMFELVKTIDFVDHHLYSDTDIYRLIETAKNLNVKSIITTEKDGVKIKNILNTVNTNIKFYTLKLRAKLEVEQLLND